MVQPCHADEGSIASVNLYSSRFSLQFTIHPSPISTLHHSPKNCHYGINKQLAKDLIKRKQ